LGNDYVAVAAGGRHSVALRTDGSLVGWGGAGSFGLAQTPLGNDFVSISAGSTFGVALRADGSLAAWGDERYTSIPTGNDFFAIAADSDFGIALTPLPSAVVLGSIGITFSGWLLRKRKML